MSIYAEVILDFGVIPAQRTGKEDGLITIGQHKGKWLSDDDVNRHWLAWLYVFLERGLVTPPQELLDLVWFWGDSKYDEEKAFMDPDYTDFDELVDRQREIAEGEEEAKEQMSTDGLKRYVSDGKGGWKLIPV